jgi:hypothetical protein
MPRVGFEPTIVVFRQGKTIHALDCADTVVCKYLRLLLVNNGTLDRQATKISEVLCGRHIVCIYL